MVTKSLSCSACTSVVVHREKKLPPFLSGSDLQRCRLTCICQPFYKPMVAWLLLRATGFVAPKVAHALRLCQDRSGCNHCPLGNFLCTG